MEFCIISPADGLRKFASQSKYHLLLPQVRNIQYTKFYVKRREEGDFIILDNGAYEKQLVTPTRMLERIDKYKPHVVVLPDAYLDSTITWKSTLGFLDRYYDDIHKVYPTTYFMGVPNGSSLFEWYECAKKMVDDYRITWIAIPRNVATHLAPDSSDIRAACAQVVKDMRPDINIHALGMANGSLEELYHIAKCGLVASCDSSAPVWRGWNGYYLNGAVDREVWDKKGTPVNFNAHRRYRYAVENDRIIQYNLDLVLEICHSTQNGLQDSMTPAADCS